MLTRLYRALPQSIRNRHNLEHISHTDYLFGVSVVVGLLIIFAFQAPNTGFYGPNHGWTSSHGLAIMSHATPDNYFVGYSLQFNSPDRAFRYNYFDRYPIFFSVVMNLLLSVSDDLATKVQLARGVMNIVYAATLGIAFLLVNTWLQNRLLSLAAVLFAFSGWWLVFYKDMVHYDQPALLGSFLLLYAIARYQKTQPSWGIYAAALVAVSLGRGYASFMVLGLWVLIEAAHILVNHRDQRVVERIGMVFRHDAVKVSFLAVVWVSVLLSYNILIEAHQRHIPIQQTSIVDSAIRRLPIGGDKDFGRNLNIDTPDWGEFALMQSERFVRWIVPFKLESASSVGGIIMVIGMIGIAGFFARQQSRDTQVGIVLTAFWGVMWITFMINLTHGHDYTMMYVVGLPLVVYSALFTLAHRVRYLDGILTVCALTVFASSHYQVRAELINPATNRSSYTQDYNRIAERIVGTERNLYVDISDGRCVIEDDFCYVLGFYLPEHYLSDFNAADYVLTRHPYYYASPLGIDRGESSLVMRDTLTPENQHAFLFDKRQAVARLVPENVEPMVRFGEGLTLQNWRLTGEVTVRACETVHFESWWLTNTSLSANYSLLLSMVDSNGQDIADSNLDLTFLATRVWETGKYYFDTRYVTVPCDTPAGEYPLVLSVYEPGAEASLTVIDTENQPLGDYVYLTTLFVQ